MITPILIEEAKEENDLPFNKLILANGKQQYSTTVVIPAYNEEKRIGPFLESLILTLPKTTEIIVVFDGTDGTPKIVNSFGERVILMQFSKRLGKGRAIIEGFKRSKGKVVGFVDADGAISASEVKRLSDLVTDKFPCIVGSRWVRSSIVENSEPFVNLIASRMFHYLSFLILGIRTKDTQCGIKFFTRSLAMDIVDKIVVKDWMIDVALLYHTKLRGINIREVGIRWSHKDFSKFLLIKAIPIMFVTLIGLRLVHSRLIGKHLSTFGSSFSID